MRVRIVVADRCEATFYDLNHFHGELEFAGRLAHPESRLHEQDLTSDRPGRVFDHAPLQDHRRGATARHGAGGERSARDHEAEIFARHIAEVLVRARQQAHFDRLVIISPPRFLGILREILPQSVQATIVAEIAKDLVHEHLSAVRSEISVTMFRPA